MIDDTKQLALSALRIYRKDDVSLGELEVVELDNLRVEHHLEDALSILLVVHSHYVDIVAGVLILESERNRITVGAHSSGGDLLADPSGHEV